MEIDPISPIDYPVKKDRTELGVSIILLVIIIGLIFIPAMFFINREFEKEKYPKATVPIIEEFDENEFEIISNNYDFIYESSNFELLDLSEDSISLMDGSGLLPTSLWLPWYGNGAYISYVVPNQSDNVGVILLHPKYPDTPRVIAQNVTLPNTDNSIILVARISNIAKDFEASCGRSSDAIIKINIIDINMGVEEIIYETVVYSDEGWNDVVLDISKFAGKDIAFEMGGYSGGYSDWCGEHAATNKFYIATI